jgi:hypothetical protein
MESVPRFVRMLAYDGNRLSRCDLVARLPVLLERNCVEVEAIRDAARLNLLSPWAYCGLR